MAKYLPYSEKDFGDCWINNKNKIKLQRNFRKNTEILWQMDNTICIKDLYVKAWKLRSNGRTHKLNGKKSRKTSKKMHKITEEEEERRKANKFIKGLKMDMETQSRRISSNNATSENRTRARVEFLFLKSSWTNRKWKLEKAKDQPSLLPKWRGRVLKILVCTKQTKDQITWY